MLPILDPTCDADTYYKLSLLVFWVVLITGARRYELDPTLLDRLAPSVTQLALKSMPQISHYFSTICGLLILCTWPLPMKKLFDDPSPMYSGAAMQLALQQGMHTLYKRQDGCAEDAYEPSVARVWAYLEFVYHWYGSKVHSAGHSN